MRQLRPDGDRTLAELVTARPALARVLERHGLDYCCGGARTLGAACAEAGIDADAVAAELTAVAAGDLGPAPDWASTGPAELVDHVESTHHRFLERELPRLSVLAAKVAEVHGARHPELAEVRDTFEALRSDLVPHLLKEEQVLFPMIRELASASTAPRFHCGTLADPVRVMLGEHDRAGDLLARLRDLTDGYVVPEDGCASYLALMTGLAELEADTHLHVHKENNLLFPAVLELERRLEAAGP